MDPTQRRLNALHRHLSHSPHPEASPSCENNLQNERKSISFNAIGSTNQNIVENDRAIPRIRQEVLKWNGWGYKDSKFIFEKDPGGVWYAYLTGNRYNISNSRLPNTVEHVSSILNINPNDKREAQSPPKPSEFPSPVIEESFLNFIKESKILYSLEGDDRLFRAHGHTVAEIFTLREDTFQRIPDLVVWPRCHDDVEQIVKSAVQNNVVIIPIGGGTSVTGALLCPEEEKRMIVSLDTTEMCHILWFDHKNLTARVEAGMIGQDLEKQMFQNGYTVGHEPDSFEFSSVGGWVATRASGMKKNTYGNIEDLVVQIKAVTPQGTVEKYPCGPRISAGPDIHHFLLGSEGTLGVITEVTLKIRPLPPVKRYGSIVFPDFETGVTCFREIAANRCQPTSFRLMDNEQFRLGHAFKLEGSFFTGFVEKIKRIYLTCFKGFDVEKLTVATIVFEGSESQIAEQEKTIYEIAGKHGGIPGGATNGETGYRLTFAIAYIRDLGLDYKVVAESFETSCPWDKVSSLCHNVKHRVNKECKSRGIEHHYISCRVTQLYDAGACIYFYFAFNFSSTADPVHTYEEIENAARHEIIGCGGNVSHHHGVGKIRKQFMSQTLSSPALGSLRALKNYFDPTNIFGNNNLL